MSCHSSVPSTKESSNVLCQSFHRKIEIRNGKETVIHDGTWGVKKPFDVTWKAGTPVEITDVWTGNKYIVYPSQPPETYPAEYFGDSRNARFPFYPKSMKISIIQFEISQRKETLKNTKSKAVQESLNESIDRLTTLLNEINHNGDTK